MTEDEFKAFLRESAEEVSKKLTAIYGHFVKAGLHFREEEVIIIIIFVRRFALGRAGPSTAICTGKNRAVAARWRNHRMPAAG